MNEPVKPKSRIRHAFFIWVVFFMAIVGLLAFFDADSISHINRKPPYWQEFLFAAAGAAISLGLWLLISLVFCSWHNFRRTLIGAAILATLLAIFYTEENWRGKRAWDNCKRELEAKGVVLDWDKFIPPPVPDDQNFYTASTNIALRFVKTRTDAQGEAASKQQWLHFQWNSNLFRVFDSSKSGPVVIARLTILSAHETNSAFEKYKPVPNINEVDARELIGKRIKSMVGESIEGSQGFKFSQHPLGNLVQQPIFLQADAPPSVADLEKVIPANIVTNIGSIHIVTTADNKTFQIELRAGPITAAEDYLKWSDQYVPAFDEVREALKRPYAIIPGDYSVPYLIPIPNFVTLRSVAQTLAQRAQCDFLLGRPEDALREVMLIHDLCRILEKPPIGQPITLVEAMINVAISGLYANTVADGFRLNAWRESQIVALQNQFKEINLSSTVHDAFAIVRASITCTIEKTPASKIAELTRMSVVASGKIKSSFWKKAGDPMYLFFRFCPRGWIYQNMVYVVSCVQSLDAVDLEQGTISPQLIEKSMKNLEKTLNRRTPFNVWARISIPNFIKVWQTTAHNQTFIDEARIACALERFHLAHGEYPETLDVLMPQFIEKLPHDIIGGQPLHYRRTDEGKFLLYSIGWDEKDDGGQVFLTKAGAVDLEKGDWVWQYPQK